MHLLLIGINHEAAPVKVREQLCFSDEQAEDGLKHLKGVAGIQGALLISTCNRTELVVHHELAPEEITAFRNVLIDELCHLRGGADIEHELFYSYQDSEAVEHLFRLAAGMVSMILGEPQIFGQVKQAYKIACQAETSNYMINKLMHRVFKAGKRIRTETSIGEGSGSISQAAADLALECLREHGWRNVLVIGAGEMARICVEALAAARCQRITVVNRTLAKARQLAAIHNCHVLPFDRLDTALHENHVIITAAGGDKPLIPPDRIQAQGEKTIIDIAVPRNVDPAIAHLDGIRLQTIDDLQSVVDRSVAARQREIPQAEAIVSEEMSAFTYWFRSLAVEPVVRELLTTYDEIRKDELERMRQQVDDDTFDKLDALTNRLVKKILHHPICHLKNSHDGHVDKSEYWIEVISDVFDLEGFEHE